MAHDAAAVDEANAVAMIPVEGAGHDVDLPAVPAAAADVVVPAAAADVVVPQPAAAAAGRVHLDCDCATSGGSCTYGKRTRSKTAYQFWQGDFAAQRRASGIRLAW